MELKYANSKDIVKLKRWDQVLKILPWNRLKYKLVKKFIQPIVYRVVDAEMSGDAVETFDKFITYPNLTPEDVIRLKYGNKYNLS